MTRDCRKEFQGKKKKRRKGFQIDIATKYIHKDITTQQRKKLLNENDKTHLATLIQ